MLEYNGGHPLVDAVTGRDDDPNQPYQYGDGVRAFFKLTPSSLFARFVARVAGYERLELPSSHPWKLPPYLLQIGDDAGGNAFMMDLRSGLIRFVDHERTLQPLEKHRIMADDFGDDSVARQRNEPLEHRAVFEESTLISEAPCARTTPTSSRGSTR